MKMCLMHHRNTTLSQDINSYYFLHTILLGKKSQDRLCSLLTNLENEEGKPFRDVTYSRRPFQLLAEAPCVVCQLMKFTDFYTQKQNRHSWLFQPNHGSPLCALQSSFRGLKKTNFYLFPWGWSWQVKRNLSSGKSLPALKERSFAKLSPDPKQNKARGEDAAFPIARPENARREDEAADPMCHLTDRIWPQNHGACQGCLCWAVPVQGDVLQGGRSEHRPPDPCFLVGWFVLFCGCQPTLFPLPLER